MLPGDRNLQALLTGREVGGYDASGPHSIRGAVQMHEALVRRLTLDSTLEGHTGCVNSIAWNKSGSLLVSGSDDTRVNVWDYGSRRLLYSVDSGHSANIFCTQFMPECNDEIIASGAGDGEVRIHRLNRGGTESQGGVRVLACHTRRVKKLAVEPGNPYLVWSASEDGTLRQHDLRERGPCRQGFQDECRSVLLDLRGAMKRSLAAPPRHCLALKSCAIHPTRPNHILVGGSDAFARLYDRRMLPTPSSMCRDAHPVPAPPCVCYYAPAHLAEATKQGLHLTHVTFNPQGTDVLLSYSGEHVYRMPAIPGNPSSVYRAPNVASKTVLPMPENGISGHATPELDRSGESVEAATGGQASLAFKRYLRCEQKLASASERLSDSSGPENCTRVIEELSEVLEGKGLGPSIVGPGLRHDCLCTRAAALTKRGWRNDAHMALRDCNSARVMDAYSVPAHQRTSEALLQLKRYRQALQFAERAHQLDPANPGLAELVVLTAGRVREASEERRRRQRNNGEQGIPHENGSGMRTRVRLRDWLVGEDGPIDQMEEEDEYDDREESGSGHDSEDTPSVAEESDGNMDSSFEGDFLGSSTAPEASHPPMRGPGTLPRGDFQFASSSSPPSTTSEDSGAGCRRLGGPGASLPVPAMPSSYPEMTSPGFGMTPPSPGLTSPFQQASLGLVDSPVSVLDLEGRGNGGRKDQTGERMGPEARAESEGSRGSEGHRRALSGGSAGSSGRKSSRERLDEASGEAHNTKSARRKVLDAEEYALDMVQRYVGHCNTGTDIKQASFLGGGGEFVASGSDDGRWFVWEARTGQLVKVLAGDENVVNCVQAHPYDCAVATSGIDDTIKIWSPLAENPSSVSGGVAGPQPLDTVQVMAENQKSMWRPRVVGLPMELLQRLRVAGDAEGGVHRIECAQS
ncbi:hypothetical protein KFL_000170560 [Klebsormidium nitens]|uniref:WD and tetratricopeptide repeats protein 1 n=1 Tax=Klebsormidium nitens TaxID=105231 RepID=A0A1Y1HJK1_KLENI|nr:hypothetical protein KFL_000170560 [Klebsormidium nitens]|eukprot:GAQ78710.1 hypothetical protein KFL_000170560 [Klebsormidium nitens]